MKKICIKKKKKIFTGLTFNKIVLPSDEEIAKYNKRRDEMQNKKIENIIENENDIDLKCNNWNPIGIRYNDNGNFSDNKIFGINYNLNTDDYYDINNFNIFNNNDKKQEKKSGFAEAAMILSHLDNDYIDLKADNSEKKEYILATERPDSEFNKNNKFQNLINNKNSYILYDPYSTNEREIINTDIQKSNNNHLFESNNNLININEKKRNSINDINLVNNNNNINDYEISNNEVKDNNLYNPLVPFSFNKEFLNNNDNYEELNKNKNEHIFNDKETKTNSNTNTSTMITRKNQLVNVNNNNSNEILNNSNILNKDCKLMYSGDCNNITQLKSPIVIKLSSIILNSSLFNQNQNITIDFDLILDIIKKYICSIDDIDNKIVLPSEEDIFLLISGKIYSKLTNISIELKNIEKRKDENNNEYYFINYSFTLRQYPILVPELDNDINYIIKPTINELLDSNNKYDLKKIENFEISNKFGKIVFLEPIDLSGKVIINDIIKINDGDIDLSNSRVDKLKAKVFLNFDFGIKLEGKFLENIKEFLKHKNSNFVKYENKVLEYNANF